MRVLAVKRRLREWTHSVRPSAPFGVMWRQRGQLLHSMQKTRITEWNYQTTFTLRDKLLEFWVHPSGRTTEAPNSQLSFKLTQ